MSCGEMKKEAAEGKKEEEGTNSVSGAGQD